MANGTLVVPQGTSLPKTIAVMDFLDEFVFQHTKPYTIAGPLPPEEESRRTNLVTKPGSVEVKDLRGFEGHLEITKNGFEIVHRPSIFSLKDSDDDSIQSYLVDVTTWLKQRLDAEHCYCYAYKVS